MARRLLGSGMCMLVAALGLSACGSGGGGGVSPIPPAPAAPAPTPSPTPTPTPTPTPSPTPGTNYNTAEYQRSAYAGAANAISAYNAGATGKGVKIGIIDGGLNAQLAEFAGRVDAASGDVAGSRGVSDDGGHGTAVTAVAAAGRNGQDTLGMAFDATIVSERADSPGSCSQKDGCQFFDSAIAAGIDAARNAGAKVINLSLGGSTPGTQLIAAMQRAVNAGIVLVIAAGNDGTDPTKGANPDPFALIPAQNFAGSVIIAGSIGAPSGSGTNLNLISDFSNRAGSGAAYYLTALGYQAQAPDNTGAQFLWSGTSFSAPAISGAVALMAQAFPNLTGKQIVSILFSTADDLGTPGVDSVYGNGRLNLQRAFAPAGTTSLAGSQIPVTGSDLPPASGDAAKGQSVGAIILDRYNRAYVLNLAATLRSASADHPLSRSLQNDVRVAGGQVGPLNLAMTVHQRHDLVEGYSVDRMGIGPQDLRRSRLMAGSALARIGDRTAVAFGFAEGAKAMERRLNGRAAGAFLIASDIAGSPGFAAKRNSSLAVRRELSGLGLTVSGETGNVWQDVRTSATGSPYRLATLTADRRFGSNWLSLGVSRLDEKQTLLGGRLSPLLQGGGAAATAFVDAELRWSFGAGWSSTISARRGWTRFGANSLKTSAYSLDVAKRGLLTGNDSLGIRVAQPLRVERGGLALTVPTAWDYLTETATYLSSTMSLKPSGREVDGEVSYGSTLFVGRGWFDGNLYVRRQPGHIAAMRSDVGAAVRFSLGF